MHKGDLSKSCCGPRFALLCAAMCYGLHTAAVHIPVLVLARSSTGVQLYGTTVLLGIPTGSTGTVVRTAAAAKLRSMHVAAAAAAAAAAQRWWGAHSSMHGSSSGGRVQCADATFAPSTCTHGLIHVALANPPLPRMCAITTLPA
jgi:hypothetical protein